MFEIVSRWEDETDLCKFPILLTLKTDFTDFDSCDESTKTTLPPLRRIRNIYSIDSIIDVKEFVIDDNKECLSVRSPQITGQGQIAPN